MADDVTFQTTVATPPSGTKVATDDVGGVHYQKVKLDLGDDGASDPAVGTVPVSGTVTVTEPVSVDDNGGSLTIDGAVSVSNFPATQPVSGTITANAGTGPFPVSDNGGSLTVDGTVAVSGTVTVDGSGVTQPISHAALTELAAAIDTELQVDVVGSLPAGNANIGDVDIASIAAGDNNIGNVDIVTMPNVTIGAAIPAGTNAIGKLAANSGVDIGDVDVTSLPALPSGTNNIGDVDVASLPKSGTATLSNVASSASNVTLLSSNASRLGASIHNDSTAILYVKFGTTASTTSFTVKMAADAHYEVPFGYTGRIDGIWASADGAARMTELT